VHILLLFSRLLAIAVLDVAHDRFCWNHSLNNGAGIFQICVWHLCQNYVFLSN